MNTKNTKRWLLLASALGLGLIVAVASGVGAYVGIQIGQQSKSSLLDSIPLQAGTASRGKSLSMATGLIDGDVEGLFVLDHISGNLQCWILNSKSGEVAGIYTANVVADLAADKSGEPDYIMSTGNFFFSGRRSGNLEPAKSVVYIADGTSGNVVGYSLRYDKQAINRGIVQRDLLTLVCKGPARDVVTRDQ